MDTATKVGHATVLPPDDLEPMLDLSQFLSQVSEPAVLVGPDGQTVPLPLEAFEVLSRVADAMRHGKAITVAPVDQLLTTQEAADFLGVSRPTVVKLLTAGRIPHTAPGMGRHRRVRLADLLEYQRAASADRRTALDAMTVDAADAGLYEEDFDYSDALRKARGKKE
ncbi:MAG: helix-turn-helix domain-containing protein [Propionibacteriaceae bacterium]|nr:helix-turn-helix domain-containing protein [Propionibacteriaceae bacterium]